MEQKEMKDLSISAVLLAFAFGNVYAGWNWDLLPFAFLLALGTISISFVCHELGHRFVARMFGCYSEYKMWPQGLILAVGFSFLGFVFAAPGAVVIYPRADLWGNVQTITRKMNGIISVAGPAINIVLGFGFLLMGFLTPFANIAAMGVMINSWLAIFNLIPFGPLDGLKVFAWDKRVWLVLLILAGVLFFF